MFDKATILQVFGCLLLEPNLLLEEEYGDLRVEDFPEKFHQIVFGAIHNLIKSNVKNLSPMEVDSFLSSYNKNYTIFTDNNGIEYIDKCMQLAKVENFQYNYKRLKKFSLLKFYRDQGFDTKVIYNDQLLDTKQQEEQQVKFDTREIDEIIDYFDTIVIQSRDEYAKNLGQEGQQAGKKLKELKETLKLTPEMGAPLDSGILTTITRGARKKKFYIRSAESGLGKAIPNYFKIPTPSGWKTIGDIKVGDELFARDGKTTKVLQIHPQPTKKEVYEVHFKDGRVVESCEDHLWEYSYQKDRPRVVETTKQLLDRAEGLGGFKSGRGFRYKIPMNQAVEYPTKEFSLHPYTMGTMLGDASFRTSAKNKSLEYSSYDLEIVSKIANLENWGFSKSNANNNTWHFEHKNVAKVGRYHNMVWVEEALADYPNLWNVKSGDKFIPQHYLLGDVEQRRFLLQGLLDTDGSISKKGGRVGFSTTSEKMKDGIIELCRSLGYVANFSKDTREDKYTNGVCYEIRILTPKSEKVNMFSYTPKKQKAIDYVSVEKRSEANDWLAISDIVRTKKLVDMTCFTVDNEEALFQVGDFIVTHNTRLAIGDACKIAIRNVYDTELGEWIDRKYSEPTLFITTELEINEIQTPMVAYVSGVDEDKLLSFTYNEEEEKRIDRAIEIIAESPIWIEHIPSFNMTDIERAIKKYKVNHDVSYVFFDYIFTSPKMLMEIASQTRGMKLREDNVLYLFADRMKYLCNTLDVFIYSATQVNGEIKHVKTADEAVLRGAKSIADKIDIGLIAMQVTKADLESLANILPAFSVLPNLVYNIYKVRKGRFVRVKLWCYIDLGTCRTKDLFLTNNDYEVIDIEATTVEQILDSNMYTKEEMEALEAPIEAMEEEKEEGGFKW